MTEELIRLKRAIENELTDEQHLWLLNFIGNKMGLRKKIVERDKYCLIDVSELTADQVKIIADFVNGTLLRDRRAIPEPL